MQMTSRTKLANRIVSKMKIPDPRCREDAKVAARKIAKTLAVLGFKNHEVADAILSRIPAIPLAFSECPAAGVAELGRMIRYEIGGVR
jgi:hypothetical protein